nr:substrate-binding domain-containing protein [Bacillus sp. SA1-12]
MSFGEINHPVLGERIKGAKISLEAIGIKVVTETAKQNEPDQVKKAMKLILKNHPDVKGAYTTTDINALNVIVILEEQGYKIPVIGADGITELIKLVEE